VKGKHYILIFDKVECLGTVYGGHGGTMFFLTKKDAINYIKEVLDGDFDRYRVCSSANMRLQNDWIR